MATAPDITVSIVSHDTCDLLWLCLRSLEERREAGEVSLEVVVLDNASTDGTVAMVQTEFPWVRLQRSAENLGYGRGNNAALADARGRYVFILNSDTQVMPGALARLRDFLDAHSEAAAVAPRLLLPDGQVQAYRLDDPSLGAIFCEQTQLSRLARRTMPDVAPQSVHQLCGAALLVRREAYVALQGFDPAFFMYFEDVDLCFRLRRLGASLWYLPSATIRHNLGGSSQSDWRDRAQMIVAHNQSGSVFFRRSYGPRAAARLGLIWRLGAGSRLVVWKALSLVSPKAREQALLFSEVWRQARMTAPERRR